MWSELASASASNRSARKHVQKLKSRCLKGHLRAWIDRPSPAPENPNQAPGALRSLWDVCSPTRSSGSESAHRVPSAAARVASKDDRWARRRICLSARHVIPAAYRCDAASSTSGATSDASWFEINVSGESKKVALADRPLTAATPPRAAASNRTSQCKSVAPDIGLVTHRTRQSTRRARCLCASC